MATRNFEDVKEGDAIPPFVVENLSRTDLVKYAGASGDFNPIHHDEGFARSAGNPTVFGHGMLTAGFVARCSTDFVGGETVRRDRGGLRNGTNPTAKGVSTVRWLPSTRRARSRSRGRSRRRCRSAGETVLDN